MGFTSRMKNDAPSEMRNPLRARFPACSNICMKRGQTILLIGAVAFSLALANESVTVQRKLLDVRAAKSQMSPVVFTANQGDSLTITDRPGDGWLGVKSATDDTKAGFVREMQLTDPRATAAPSSSSVAYGSRDADASAAMKGIDPDALKYAGTKHYDTAAVARMIDMRDSIKPSDLDQFRKEGGLK